MIIRLFPLILSIYHCTQSEHTFSISHQQILKKYAFHFSLIMTKMCKVAALMLVCFVLSVKSIESFGFDVHHRYSDTVKSFLGVDGLPEKGTVDYYTAMAHRDHHVNSRRLAGGSDGSSTPSSNSTVLTFFGGSKNTTFNLGALGFLHYAFVRVGTPYVTFLVALDTGSDLFWLPCDCPTCPRSFNLSGGPIYLDIYSPSNSTSSSPVPCNSPLCGQDRGCATRRNNTCSYQEVYRYANTSSTGLLIEDVLRMGTDEMPQSPTDAPITLGCGMIQTGRFMAGGAINGLMGLGMDSISVPSTLASKGLIGANSLSMCFRNTGLGRIDFGDKGSPNQKVTPFNVQPSNPSYNVTVTEIAVENNATNVTFTAVFESGIAFTYLTEPAYTIITEGFNAFVAEKRYRPTPGLIFEYCYEMGVGQDTYTIPYLNFTMRGGDVFVASAYTVWVPGQGVDAYCLGVIKSEGVNIIGQNFMTGYRIVFDRDEMVLGWEETDCGSYSFSSTSTPGTSNSTADDAPPSPSLVPGTTFGNRTRTPLLPPPPPPARSGSNAAYSSWFSTMLLTMAMISITSSQL